MYKKNKIKGDNKKIINNYNDKDLANIFNCIYNTLIEQSNYSKQEFEEKFNNFKHYEKRKLDNNEYYQLLVDIIFYSGFKAATVNKYINTIHKHFANYIEVSNYSNYQIDKINNDYKMIKNKSKINACIKNAKKIVEIVKEYGSVTEYIESFNPNLNDERLNNLKSSLIYNFNYIGDITVYHFMTDIGLNVIKPDRVLLRIFSRLGLVENKNDYFGAIKIGRAFSKATKLPIRYIDLIFVLYGQLDLEKITCICSEKRPKCNICGVKSHCLYTKVN